MTNYQGGDVSVLIGEGDGTFEHPAQVYDIGTLTQVGFSELAAGITTADFNNDGDLDIAATCYLAGTSDILLGNGDGTFEPQDTTEGLFNASWVASGDLDLDGNVDMVIAIGAALSVCFGEGDGTFQTPQTMTVGVDPWYVEIADVNSDGLPDLVVSDPNVGTAASEVFVVFNQGPWCNQADIAEPFGTLNINDLDAFTNGFNAGCP